MEGAPEDLEDFAALPLIGVRPPGTSPSALLFETTYARDATMKNDYRPVSRGTVARTNELPVRAIFWGMVFTVLVVVAWMIRGMLG